MSRKVAQYCSQACLAYALVLLGATILDGFAGSAAGPHSLPWRANSFAAALACLVSLLLLVLGAWFAKRS